MNSSIGILFEHGNRDHILTIVADQEDVPQSIRDAEQVAKAVTRSLELSLGPLFKDALVLWGHGWTPMIEKIAIMNTSGDPKVLRLIRNAIAEACPTAEIVGESRD